MEQIRESGIAVILVLYNPKEEDVANARNVASRNRGVIVDNSTVSITKDKKVGRMHYVCNYANLGIAEAQNMGIRMMMAEGVDYFVFLDQDSRVGIDYPWRMVQAYMAAKTDMPNLAVLGPTVKRLEGGGEYKPSIHCKHVVGDWFKPRREVISSGCCIDVDAINKVGYYDSRLFIDAVDHEWCWRAASKGLVCGVTPNVCIAHKVGQRELHIGHHVVIISRPFRYFYQYRNYLWLLRRKYVPLQWKVAVGVKYFLRMFYFPFCINNWVEIEKNMFKGLWHGLRPMP